MKHKRKAPSLPSSMLEIALASCETVARRTLLIAENKCSPEEYQRMVLEKFEAAIESSILFMATGGLASAKDLMEPWRKRAIANVARLRKK